jgi:hypothetical protein
MSRRKGEQTARMNERDFPHMVELPLPPGGLGGRDVDIATFHIERGVMPAMTASFASGYALPIRVMRTRFSNGLAASAPTHVLHDNCAAGQVGPRLISLIVFKERP